MNDDDFRRELEAMFRLEAEEHVQAISSGLLEMEKGERSEQHAGIIESVFRAAHSLKGAARAVDASQVESLCESLEDTFASWKRGNIVPDPQGLDTLQRLLDRVRAALATMTAEHPAPPPASPQQPLPMSAPRPAAPSPPYAPSQASMREHEVAPRGASSLVVAPPERHDLHESVRVPVAKLQARLRESEEMLTLKLAAAQRVAEFRELSVRLTAWRKTWVAVERDARHLRQRLAASDEGVVRAEDASLSRLLDFLDSSLDVCKSMEARAVALRSAAEQDRNAAAKLVDDLLNDSKKLLLLPFGTISGAFQKMVRDLCRAQGKEADFYVVGEEIELDKRILEEIKDPLVHLLRNSVDHGIEPPAERQCRGKMRRAVIRLTVSQLDTDKVQVTLSDDGAGIDVTKLKDAAVKRQLVTRADAERLTLAAAQALIFESGLSTSAIITSVSGRGLGLAIVKEKAEKLGGGVSVESATGEGTTFRIIVPAMQATFRGIVVETAGRLMVLPTAQVACVMRAKRRDVRTIEGRETVSHSGRALPLVRLADVLELASTGRRDNAPVDRPAVVLGNGDQRVAFAVDAIHDEQEVIVKPLRKPLSRVRNVAAATVLGSGQVAPILHVGDLLKSARSTAAVPAPTASEPSALPASSRSVLVAEDSITSRVLLKAILQSAGYKVKTAVDGMEAFTLLRSEHFDLLVSDVEMPRLNGLELCARIRADAKLGGLPVILVTALETREHRERGIDVGANAYLVKSSVNQSNLLDAVQRLI